MMPECHGPARSIWNGSEICAEGNKLHQALGDVGPMEAKLTVSSDERRLFLHVGLMAGASGK